jgi:type I restriction enzyme S subunit
MCTWREKRLGDYISINPATLTVAKYNGSIQYIDISSVSVGQLYGYAEYDINDAPSRARRIIQPNDIIFSTVRPNLRAYYYVKECPTNAICSTGFAVLRAKKNANSRFIYYLVTEKSFVDYLSLVAKGSAYPAVDTNDFKKAKVSIPDLPTQQRIADILSTYDDLIENNNKRIALLEKAAQELYKEWFVRFRFPGHETTKFVNGLPEGWEVKKVKSLVNRLPFGTLYKSENTLPEGKVIVIDQSQDAYAGFHNDAPSHIASIENPIALFGDHSCKYQLMITPFSLSENVVPYTAKGDMLTVYLYYSLCGLVETSEYKRHWKELMSKKVLVAPHDLQKNFSIFLKDKLLLIESLKEQNFNLAKQRDLLLPRLMSGKLEV